MISICKIFEFAAAHKLPNHGGLCKNIHGHNYKLEVQVEADGICFDGEETGMIMDFSELKSLIKQVIIKPLDHTNLNTRWDHPTAETMIVSLSDDIKEYLDDINSARAMNGNGSPDLRLQRLRLWETSTSYAEWIR